jgi:hypothetical protein
MVKIGYMLSPDNMFRATRWGQLLNSFVLVTGTNYHSTSRMENSISTDGLFASNDVCKSPPESARLLLKNLLAWLRGWQVHPSPLPVMRFEYVYVGDASL